MSPFLVADTETIIYDGKVFQPISRERDFEGKVHSPFAIGVMIVRPCVPVKESNIDYYYSSDYPDRIFPTHKERSTR